MVRVIEPSFEIEQLDGIQACQWIERAARVCYKSEGKITADSYRPFLQKLISLGHESTLEHVGVTVRFICDRGVSHELVRHRVASFSQECVAGDTRVTQRYTIKELFERQAYGKTHNKMIHLRSCSDDGTIVKNKIAAVMYKGKQPTWRVTTQLGYVIETTSSHEFLLPDGSFARLGELNVGERVMVNGRPSMLRINDTALRHHYMSERLAPQEIADRFGAPYNLMRVCINCHKKLHHGWHVGVVAHPDAIVAIDFVREQDVYDIEMEAPYHNYVANGFVVHNSTRYCDYSRDQHGHEITVIEPIGLKPEARHQWLWAMQRAEESYFGMLAAGESPQMARSVLPNSLKTEVVMTANMREWRHVLRLRTSGRAHPQMRQLMVPLLAEFQRMIPVLFDDVVVS